MFRDLLFHHQDRSRYQHRQAPPRSSRPKSRGFLAVFGSSSPARGPFLERPGNLPGPESDFYIKVSRKVGCVLTSDEVHFVSLADNFTVQLSNFLKLPLDWKTKQLNGPSNYRELRETGPRSEFHTEHLILQEVT